MSSILLLFLVPLCLVITVAVAGANQAAGRTRHRSPFSRNEPLGPERGVHARTDPALAELRMRYARGEIAREEFLQRKIDLE